MSHLKSIGIGKICAKQPRITKTDIATTTIRISHQRRVLCFTASKSLPKTLE